MYCKQCGVELPSNTPKCLKCGTKVGKGKRYCPNCGQPSSVMATSCESCGYILGDDYKLPNWNEKTAMPTTPTAPAPVIPESPVQQAVPTAPAPAMPETPVQQVVHTVPTSVIPAQPVISKDQANIPDLLDEALHMAPNVITVDKMDPERSDAIAECFSGHAGATTYHGENTPTQIVQPAQDAKKVQVAPSVHTNQTSQSIFDRVKQVEQAKGQALEPKKAESPISTTPVEETQVAEVQNTENLASDNAESSEPPIVPAITAKQIVQNNPLLKKINDCKTTEVNIDPKLIYDPEELEYMNSLNPQKNGVDYKAKYEESNKAKTDKNDSTSSPDAVDETEQSNDSDNPVNFDENNQPALTKKEIKAKQKQEKADKKQAIADEKRTRALAKKQDKAFASQQTQEIPKIELPSNNTIPLSSAPKQTDSLIPEIMPELKGKDIQRKITFLDILGLAGFVITSAGAFNQTVVTRGVLTTIGVLLSVAGMKGKYGYFAKASIVVAAASITLILVQKYVTGTNS